MHTSTIFLGKSFSKLLVANKEDTDNKNEKDRVIIQLVRACSETCCLLLRESCLILCNSAQLLGQLLQMLSKRLREWPLARHLSRVRIGFGLVEREQSASPS